MKNSESILRWGIIGCGDVANRKGGPPLYSVSGSNLIAVMSRNPEKTRQFAKQHGAKKCYDTVEELLSDEEINAVYVATPVSSHRSQTIAAANAGKHVLCEKPMAMNVDECRQMIDACKENDVTLMIAYYRRTFPNIVKAKELIEEGVIGDVVLAKVMNNSQFDPEQNEITDWRVDPKIGGGGALMDIGSHRLDLLLYLFGEADEISGKCSRVSFPYPVENSVTFFMQFKTGVEAMGYIGWALPGNYDSLEIHGTSGKIVIDAINNGRLQLQTKTEKKELQLPVLEFSHIGLIEDFVRHIKTGSSIFCSGEDGMKTNELMAQIYANT